VVVVWSFTFTYTSSVCRVSFLSCLILRLLQNCYLGGQLDVLIVLLASLAARCRVCLLSLHYCILFNARWVNISDWLIDPWTLCLLALVCFVQSKISPRYRCEKVIQKLFTSSEKQYLQPTGKPRFIEIHLAVFELICPSCASAQWQIYGNDSTSWHTQRHASVITDAHLSESITHARQAVSLANCIIMLRTPRVCMCARADEITTVLRQCWVKVQWSTTVVGELSNMQAIRHLASRDRHRYQRHDFDLDLSCILRGRRVMVFFTKQENRCRNEISHYYDVWWWQA